jgi:hypothetical protein
VNAGSEPNGGWRAADKRTVDLDVCAGIFRRDYYDRKSFRSPERLELMAPTQALRNLFT